MRGAPAFDARESSIVRIRIIVLRGRDRREVVTRIFTAAYSNRSEQFPSDPNDCFLHPSGEAAPQTKEHHEN
jgi:hypothetical protein